MMIPTEQRCDKAEGSTKTPPGKTHPRWHRILFFVMFLLFTFAVYSCMWWVVSLLFNTLGVASEVLIFAVTIIAGFVILALCGLAFKRYTFRNGKKMRHESWQYGQEILEALDRISQGDFNVKLASNEHEPFSELAESVNKMASELGTLEQQRQEFISDVSHEIQSPLTSIQGFASLLLSTPHTEEEARHYLGIIETEATRLSRLSDNLLRLTALDSDETELGKSEYSLDEQLRSALLILEPHWAQKRIEFDLQLDALTYWGDEDLLNQVWINLIHNAVKFSSDGGCVSVLLRASEDETSYTVVIKDSGTGIDEQDLPHIFKRFYRADKARDRSEGGNGLGLSLVKRIVELHMGSIAVSSEVSQGTTFTIILPLHEMG